MCMTWTTTIVESGMQIIIISTHCHLTNLLLFSTNSKYVQTSVLLPTQRSLSPYDFYTQAHSVAMSAGCSDPSSGPDIRGA